VHIGLFTDSYLPRRSGVVQAVESASRHLRRRGHRVSIMAPASPGYIDADPDVYRFPSVAAPGSPDFQLALPYSATLLRQIRGMRLDVVHSHSPFILGGLGMWVGRWVRVPVVFTYHTLYAEYAHYAPVVGELTRPLLVAYTTAYCNLSDRVLASVPSLAVQLRLYGVRAPIEVIPSVGIEPEEFQNPGRADRARAEFGISESAPLLVFVGRLAKEKDIPLLLEVLAVLPAAVRLLLVGEGPERVALEAQAERLGLSGRAVFAGGLPHERVAAVLCASDVFVFPSQTETLGLAVVEAMAAGLAVVAARGGASIDLVEDGVSGRLVAPSRDAFAGAVLELLRDPDLRAEMGRAGRAASEEYAQNRIIDRLIAMYHGVIAEHGQTAASHSN
jgi:glycosyltransferase involved in cell wall biosynthesis